MWTAQPWAGLCLLLGGFLCSAALAADVTPNPKNFEPAQPLPAVDGINAKASGFGGAANGNGLYGGEGSVTVPLGFRYGLQIDGIITSSNTDTQGNVTAAGTAAHLFWRDPARGLIGAYGHYIHANAFSGVDVYAGAAEGALYLGRFTLEGVAGAQGGQADPGAFNSVNIDTRFFDVAQLAWYPIDNLKLSIGHSYLFDKHAALFGAEWGLTTGSGTMAALFVNGLVSEGGDGAVLGGLRFYFGQRDKSLIRRHREDDPPSTPSAVVTINSTFANATPGGY